MSKFIKKFSKTAGRAPGEIVHVGARKMEKSKITIIDYDAGQIQEKEVKTVEECFPFKDKPTITWINIDGIHNTEIIEKIGSYFDIHPLALEDIVNTGQRPKCEDFEKYIFVVLKMLYEGKNNADIEAEQVSVIFGPNFVISFQEKEGDVFNAVRERIRNAKSRIRKMGADYLAYALLDSVVDNYFVILEKIGEKIEGMEEELVKNPTPQTLQTIHTLKREMIFLRKSVWPLREVINSLARGESELIQATTLVYLKDLYDHTIQVIDTIETFRDMISGMLDIYLSSISNKMNEVMKVLTIIATIFIPITFIAGIYGMNFNPEASSWNMPELNWRYGYLITWGIILVVVLLMLGYFRRKKWL
ncbi:MAG: magnesium/cobalt transporter CorA [Candidatus Omnitrophota bacterium]|nr:MAG: magnesium/cobalt transporter CorA [Candidatus Omnitrophota bacterium]